LVKTKLGQNAMAQTAMAQPAMTQASVPAQVFKTKAETKHGLQNHDWAQSLVSPPLGPSTASENHVIASP
jgi:predicted component of type VI protein secretion system